ncbi:MAG: hypothetical protein ACI855_005419 [Myxococcota bacterium]|jgi:hypothetical protein
MTPVVSSKQPRTSFPKVWSKAVNFESLSHAGSRSVSLSTPALCQRALLTVNVLSSDAVFSARVQPPPSVV